MEITNYIIKLIKQKKELSDIPDKIVKEYLDIYCKKHNITLAIIKKSEIKIILKDIRSQLHNLTGMFQKTLKNRPRLLEKNKLKELLKTHSSTAERLGFYPELKNLIFSLKINSILDLACGLNPVALASKNSKYYACDIKQDDLTIIKRFFKKNNIKGKVFIYDLKKINNNLPKTDLCILFKVLDIIEQKGHKLAEKIILSVRSKYVLISFATKTLSGKSMRLERRIWLEKLLERLNYHYKIFNSKNEIFYLVEKPIPLI